MYYTPVVAWRFFGRRLALQGSVVTLPETACFVLPRHEQIAKEEDRKLFCQSTRPTEGRQHLHPLGEGEGQVPGRSWRHSCQMGKWLLAISSAVSVEQVGTGILLQHSNRLL